MAWKHDTGSSQPVIHLAPDTMADSADALNCSIRYLVSHSRGIAPSVLLGSGTTASAYLWRKKNIVCELIRSRFIVKECFDSSVDRGSASGSSGLWFNSKNSHKSMYHYFVFLKYLE